MHEWMTDNSHTPYLVVDAELPGVDVPDGYINDGRIVLNVSYSAVEHLQMGNDHIAFRARFGGAPFAIHVPVAAVLAIYARETGQGVVFSEGGDSPTDDGDGPDGSGQSRPALKVVK